MSAPGWQLEPRLALACRSCAAPRKGNPKKTFLGFQRVVCEQCGHESLYPLTKTYVVIYWVAILLITGACANLIINGQIPIPGLLFFAGIYGLVRDRQIYKEVVETPEDDTTLLKDK